MRGPKHILSLPILRDMDGPGELHDAASPLVVIATASLGISWQMVALREVWRSTSISGKTRRLGIQEEDRSGASSAWARRAKKQL